METEIFLGIIDVARQASQPAAAKTGPYQHADGGDGQSGNDEQFSKVIHSSFIRIQILYHSPGKWREVARRAAGNEVAVHDNRFVHPDGAGVFKVVLDA